MNTRRARRAISVAKGREKILLQWHEALAEGERTGAIKNHVTDKFRAKLAAGGKAISRATLYGWETRYLAAGLEGLVDGRSGERRPPTPPTPRLMTFNLPGGVRLKMRLSAGACVEVREGRTGIEIDVECGGAAAG